MKLSDDVLKEIVTSNEIRDQKELGELLNSRGIELTQASLSRRLRKLNIQKVNGFYKVKFDHNVGHGAKLLNISLSKPNIIVVRTVPGGANYVAYDLDTIITEIDSFPGFKGMLGTVAGDDTIFIVVDEESSLERISEALQKQFS